MTGIVQGFIQLFENMSTRNVLVHNDAPTTSLSVKGLINLFESPVDTQDRQANSDDETPSDQFEITTSSVVEESLPEINSEGNALIANQTEYAFATPVGRETGNDITINPNFVQQRIAAYESIACENTAAANEIQNGAIEGKGQEVKDSQCADVYLSNKLFEKTAFPAEEDSLPEIFSEDGPVAVDRTAEICPTARAEHEGESVSDTEIHPNVDQTPHNQQDLIVNTENPFIFHVNLPASATDGAQSPNQELRNKKSRLRSMISQGLRRYKQRTEKKAEKLKDKDRPSKKVVSLHHDVTAGDKKKRGESATGAGGKGTSFWAVLFSCFRDGRNGRKIPSGDGVIGTTTSTPIEMRIPISMEKGARVTEANIQMTVSIGSVALK